MGRRSEVKDPQKKRVYKWEDGWLHAAERTLTRAETRRLVARCCKLYNTTVPRLIFLPRTNKEWSYFHGPADKLVFNYFHCNEFIVCHEVAHAIVYRRHGETIPDHGHEFMGIYLALLMNEKVAGRIALYDSAQAAGLSWIN
jgi:hypothetical protein